MMLDDNAQAIFLLTYSMTEAGVTPLTSDEYSSLALAVKKANFDGPGALLTMTEEELHTVLELTANFASRIKKLLDQAGTATLYLDRFFNQGFGLMTRTDNEYPGILKKIMLNSCPPFLTFAGNEKIINKINKPLIISIKDLKETVEPDNLIVMVETTRSIKRLRLLDNYTNNLLILTNIGLYGIVKYPIIRDLLHQKHVQIVSTSPLKAKEDRNSYKYLYSIASALSTEQKLPPGSKLNDEEQREVIIAYENSLNKNTVRVKDSQAANNKASKQQTAPLNETPPQTSESVYTIGHSNHEIDKFISLLHNHRINILIDIRSSPNSKYNTQFNQGKLRNELIKTGIQYLFLGNKLGGRPQDNTVLNSQGKIVREYIEEREWYLEGIKEIENLITTGKNIAIMCAEENPTGCHRGYIVGNTLLDKNIIVKHIRQDGTTQIRGLIAAPSDQREITF